MTRLVDKSWEKIFQDHNCKKHPFDKEAKIITAEQIKKSCQGFQQTGAKEPRILCKHDTREKRPKIFQDNGLFLLPIKNGVYCIIKGEGYMDIPNPVKQETYNSKLAFHLDTARVGNSEMQHLDFAYATSLIRSFMNDHNLILTIRGRKYTPKFEFTVGDKIIEAKGVQTEVDSGYESDKQVVLVEAKNSSSDNTIIRQLYYPLRQWQTYTQKPVRTLFFEKRRNIYILWHFEFTKIKDYNSIRLVQSKKYSIKNKF